MYMYSISESQTTMHDLHYVLDVTRTGQVFLNMSWFLLFYRTNNVIKILKSSQWNWEGSIFGLTSRSVRTQEFYQSLRDY